MAQFKSGAVEGLYDHIGTIPTGKTVEWQLNQRGVLRTYEISGNTSKTIGMYSGLIFVVRGIAGMWAVYWGGTIQQYSAASGITVSGSSGSITITNANSTTVIAITVGEYE